MERLLHSVASVRNRTQGRRVCWVPKERTRFGGLIAALLVTFTWLGVAAAAPQGVAQQADGSAARSSAEGEAPSKEGEKKAPVVAPLIELRHGQIDVMWQRTGANQRLEAALILREPVLRVLRQREQTQQEQSKPPAKPPPGTGEVVREEMPLPFEANRIAIHDMRIVFVDETVPGTEVLAIYELDLMVENFSTRRGASQGLPTLVTGRGRIGNEGRVALFVTLNPWTRKPDFAGRAQVTGLALEDLAGFVEDTIDLVPVGGSLAAFAEFSINEGRIRGGVKPILSNAEVAPADPGVVDQVKNWLVQTAIDLFSDDVPQRQAVVAVVPLSGRIDDPNAQIWDTLVSVLENAFVEAIAAGFKSVPPSPG